MAIAWRGGAYRLSTPRSRGGQPSTLTGAGGCATGEPVKRALRSLRIRQDDFHEAVSPGREHVRAVIRANVRETRGSGTVRRDRLRQRVKALVGRHRNGVRDVRVLIRDLNPVLRGWGNYFRTGNAAAKFNQMDSFVWRRLRSFLVKRKGRNLHAGDVLQWTRAFFWSLGLHRLRGTVLYPGAV